MPTFQGKTIQAAIDAGLASMQVERDAVNVEVLTAGKRGFLGFGRQAAEVTLTLIPKPEPTPVATPAPETPVASSRNDDTALAHVQSFLTETTKAMGLNVTVDQQQQGNEVTFQMTTDQDALLIGKHGKIINALQYLAQTLFNHQGKRKLSILLDVGDYRQRRATTVERLAGKSAREVVATGKSVYLDAMPALERKVIHATLADNEFVTTRSEGRDPYRYVVVLPKKQH
ncbi:RNA-binding cell elongation regulator Jag/EloR [Lacticaseibacillus brantae]|uniref:RNA-binding protein KhpB n=1 Tax=Lacticaseibacillus brantae DSM 23927 TaxID=1423727 RepID=A0A0R2B117_9LACO|nr:RNA-binding cell elongation regulator Jag/EloR [Lacticaseibacillus brantae]KRM71668.1 RNA-binding protein [Lacticaseibacillus brantae DSM 23927]